MADPSDDSALHELDPTRRFSDRAGDYVRFRPGYPAAAIDAALRGFADPHSLRAADIGAGTGISSRLLAERGVSVIAIEPNAAMHAAAAPHPLIEWCAGTGEATGLERESVDLVTCAQAFHWLHAARAVAEFHRILKPGGRLCVMWNTRDHDDPLTSDYIEAIHAVNGEHPAERREFDPAVLSDSGHFTEARLETFAFAQQLDRDGLLGRATSASYVPREGAAFVRLVELLDRVFARHREADGLVTMRYVTKVYSAERL